MSSSMTLTLPSGYGWILFDAVLIGLQVFLIGSVAGSQRKAVFGKTFFEANFPHLLKANPKVVGGYPDNGYGRFSDKLSDQEWIRFANYQRAHYNYIEGVATVLVALLVAGLRYTRSSALAGLVYVVGRGLYAAGYWSYGAKGRGIGVALLDIALIYLIGAAFTAAYNIGGGITGLFDLFAF